jgi:hypothetical protein
MELLGSKLLNFLLLALLEGFKAIKRGIVPMRSTRKPIAGREDIVETPLFLLMQLLEAIEPLQRGLTADEEDKDAIEQLAQQLEKVNPNPKSLASPLINGRWRLLYTTSESILGTKKPALLRPSGPIYQLIGRFQYRVDYNDE